MVIRSWYLKSWYMKSDYGIWISWKKFTALKFKISFDLKRSDFYRYRSRNKQKWWLFEWFRRWPSTARKEYESLELSGKRWWKWVGRKLIYVHLHGDLQQEQFDFPICLRSLTHPGSAGFSSRETSPLNCHSSDLVYKIKVIAWYLLITNDCCQKHRVTAKLQNGPKAYQLMLKYFFFSCIIVCALCTLEACRYFLLKVLLKPSRRAIVNYVIIEDCIVCMFSYYYCVLLLLVTSYDGCCRG